MAGLVKKDVLGFEVAVDETHQMEIFEGCCHFASVETSIVLRHTFARARLQR